MLIRIDCFFSLLDIAESDRELCRREAREAAEKARGMLDVRDYEALAATILRYRPIRIFEIGTYRGTTSDFFLSLLPECEVVSIAFVAPHLQLLRSSWTASLMRLLGRAYNNSELSPAEVGSRVAEARRNRFTQLYGDSHWLDAQALVEEHGPFDLVFIDGDHSAKGVLLDTQLARQIVARSGTICWHDANPKPKYAHVRRFLQTDLPILAAATADEYVGGIAVWSKDIERKLRHHGTAAPLTPPNSGNEM